MTEEPDEIGPTANRPNGRLTVGVVLVLLAITFMGTAKLVSGAQRHAYDPHATPPATYAVTAGQDYQLSSSKGVEALDKSGAIATGAQPRCVTTSEDGVQTPMQLDSVRDDPRDLHVFASWHSTITDQVHISCNGVPAVFLDDADDSPPDYSAPLIVLATLLGAIGVVMIASGAYARLSEPSDVEMAERAVDEP